MEKYHRNTGIVIQDAWQNKNLDLLREYLADGLDWYEGSFNKPLTTPDTVVLQWEKDLAKQTDLKVDIKLLDWVENRGYHHCIASWKDVSGLRHAVDAIYVIHLTPEGKITYFMPWYTSRS